VNVRKSFHFIVKRVKRSVGQNIYSGNMRMRKGPSTATCVKRVHANYPSKLSLLPVIRKRSAGRRVGGVRSLCANRVGMVLVIFSLIPIISFTLNWSEEEEDWNEEDDWIDDVTETETECDVGQAFDFDVKGAASVTVDRNRECDVPEHKQLELDKAASWGYFDEMIEKNRETVLLARSVEEHTPIRDFGNLEQHEHESREDKEDGGNYNLEPSIPHRLVFTHKDNLLDCDVSSSVNSEPSLHTFAHNVRDTVKSYKEVWGDDIQVTFLTDEDCRRALYETEPELLTYYDNLAGMFKGDLCRSAELFLNGG
jgi:hypothetical protein